MTTTQQNIRVKSIHVKNLFGRYDHDILLNESDRMTVVHGPNGVGKTVLFKLTNALLNPQASIGVLLRYPYQEFRVEFNNGHSVIATRDPEVQKRGVRLRSDADSFNEQLDESAFIRIAKRLERRLPIDQIGADRWIDRETDETLDAFNIVSRFGAENSDLFSKSISEWQRVQGALPLSHLIETQRLIKLQPTARNRTYRDNRLNSSMRDTVMEYSAQLRLKIEQTLTAYGRESQRLDQTFPQRLLKSQVSKLVLMSELGISSTLSKIAARQTIYQKLGLIGEQIEPMKFDETQLQNEVSRTAMTVYLLDMNDKLSVLDDLARRVSLLLDLINQKYSHKKLIIHPETHELTVQTDKEEQIPASALSSGEQHQIVLAYDLLFRIQPNTLVLIDEPELSLHVDWQERFLSDLRSVIDVVGFDALIATHSPYIVNGRTDLMVNLSITNEHQS